MDPINAVDNTDLVYTAQASGASVMTQDVSNAQTPPPADSPPTVQDTDVGQNIDLYA